MVRLVITRLMVGPVLRDFSIGMNRKVRAFGMVIALAAKHREGNLFVFDSLIMNHISLVSMYVMRTVPQLLHDGLTENIHLMVDESMQNSFGLARRNLRFVYDMNRMRPCELISYTAHPHRLVSSFD